jgi:MFS family permease
MNLFSKADLAAVSAVSPITSVRYRVLWLCVALYAITYMDRVCINVAAPVIAREFGFDKVVTGFIFSAFYLGYSLLQVPAGWLADRIGPRRMLTGIVLWWSAFTMLSAAAWNATSLMTVRFLFGVGEAGAFPAATRAFSRWLPASERGFAQGVTHSGSRLSGSLTNLAMGGLLVALGWRMPFVLFGSVGILWAGVWFFWYRDRPEDHSSVSSSELEWIRAGSAQQAKGQRLSWRHLLRSTNMWCLCLMYFCYGYVLVIFLSWLPTYFSEVRGMGLMKSSVYTAIPLFAGAVTNSLGGWLSDRLLLRTQNLKYSRRIVAHAGFAIAIIFMVLGVRAESPITAVAAMALAVAGLELTTGISWAIPLDIGRDYSGTVSSVMNMFGNTGSTVSPIIVGFLLERYHSWTPPFVLASILCFVAWLLWFKIDPTISVVEESV